MMVTRGFLSAAVAGLTARSTAAMAADRIPMASHLLTGATLAKGADFSTRRGIRRSGCGPCPLLRFRGPR